MQELAHFVLFEGNDPFTLPQMMVDWVPSSIPGIKVPVNRYKYYHSKVSLIVNGPDGTDVKSAAEDCLRQAALKSMIAGLIAGYASGGSAAFAAAVSTFTSTVDSCVEEKLQHGLDITAEVKNEGGWGDWQ
ncbi:MAG: hypothetical protein K2Y10_05820 [Burkholderiaceae bacterium]|nr:hypothetical protein [Burkholderiaceae bacterium]